VTLETLAVAWLLAVSVPSILKIPYELLTRFLDTWFDWLFPKTQVMDSGTDAVTDYVLLHGKVLYSGNSWWNFNHRYVRPERRSRYVFFENRAAGCRIVWFRGTLGFVGGLPWNNDVTGVLRFFRWGLDFRKLLKDVQDAHQTESTSGRFVVYHSSDLNFPWGSTLDAFSRNRSPVLSTSSPPYPQAESPPSTPRDNPTPLGYHPDDIGPPKPERPMASYAKSPESQEIVDDFSFWIENRSWYTTRGIPHRRGYGLYGRPGTGKTSLIRALAQEHDLPLLVLNLAQMDNFSLRWFMRGFQSVAPGIVVIEDVDGVFHGRERVTQGLAAEGANLTFDGLLEALDGVEQLDGIAVFVTSNHPELLDEALTRKGRIDVDVILPPPSVEGKLLIATGIMDSPQEAARMVEESPKGETAAEFKGRCIDRARDLLWASRKAA
jgi:hypothetical protein